MEQQQQQISKDKDISDFIIRQSRHPVDQPTLDPIAVHPAKELEHGHLVKQDNQQNRRQLLQDVHPVQEVLAHVFK